MEVQTSTESLRNEDFEMEEVSESSDSNPSIHAPFNSDNDKLLKRHGHRVMMFGIVEMFENDEQSNWA